MDNIINNLNLHELSIYEDLSVRSFNLCISNDLRNVVDIQNYFVKYGDFLKLRNCGQKSNKELTAICVKYKEFFKEKSSYSNTNDELLSIQKNLTIRQKNVMNNLIESQLKDLSVRSLNALENHLKSEINYKNLQTLLSNPNFDLLSLPNIGEKSTLELRSFFKSVLDQINIISVFENEEELIKELFNSYLIHRFSISKSIISQIHQDYNFKKGLPIFKTLSVLIENEIIFDTREVEIFTKSLKYFNDQDVYNLDDLSRNYNISRERARQLRRDIFDNFIPRFSFIKGFEFDALNLYGIDFQNDIVIIEDTTIKEINEKESNNFNLYFVNKIISILYSDTLSLIGNEENIIINKSVRNSHNWKYTYLVKKSINQIFNFQSFVDDVSKRLVERIEEAYKFHFETYLLSFLISETLFIPSNLILCLEHLLYNEFEIILDLDENICFARNSHKPVFEYAFEALEHLQKPSKVADIFTKVKELHPHYEIDENSIRASMKRDNGFVPISRTSVFGLKTWEEEKNIRGGTIRDITEEFLLSKDCPQNIYDITEYVNMFRDTNVKSVHSNLKMAENSRFEFYTGSLVGLKNRDYNDEKYIKTKEKNIIKQTFEERFSILKEFIETNKRLPYSSGDLEEERLYRFMNINLNKRKETMSDDANPVKIFELILPFLNTQTRKKPSTYKKTNHNPDN